MSFKSIFLFFFLFLFLESKSQKILNDDYYMVSTDDTKMYHQSNDTLFLYHCSAEFEPRFNIISRHYKIIEAKIYGDFECIKLERLDTIPLTTDPFPLNRYFILVLKDKNSKTAGQLMLINGLTKDSLDKINLKSENLSNKFYSTLISNKYKLELTSLKPISTKEDCDILIEEMNSLKYRDMVKLYQSSNINDMYGSILTAELFYRSLIAKGFNPIGSGAKFIQLMKFK